MTTARTIWQQHCVPNGPVQFFATVMVLQHMQHYAHWPAHQQRVMAILQARQYAVAATTTPRNAQ